MRIILYLIITLYTQNLLAQECDMQGRDIIQKQKDLQAVDYETVVQRMTLKDLKSNSKEKRTMKFFIKSVKNKGDKSLIVFMDPADIKGTALLNHQHNDDQDDQWLYLPGLRKVQRVAPSGKKRYFMGTDFTFADFEGEDMESFNYKCTKMIKCGGKQCYVVEAKGKDKSIIRNTGYAKRTLYIRKDIFVTNKIKFYNKKGKYLKTLVNSKWKKVSGSVYRPQKAVMTRGNVHSTTMEVANREVNQKIKDIVFEERYLVKGMHMQ